MKLAQPYQSDQGGFIYLRSTLISRSTSGSLSRGTGERGNARFIYGLKNAGTRYGHRVPLFFSFPLCLLFTDRLSHFSFAAGLPFGTIPSSFICLKDPFVHSSSSCFTCRILHAFPTPFFDRSSPIWSLANDDASHFVDETTITRYSVSTIQKWIFRERNSIRRTLRAVQFIELTYPRI